MLTGDPDDDDEEDKGRWYGPLSPAVVIEGGHDGDIHPGVLELL